MDIIETKDILFKKAKLRKPIERLQLVDALLESLDKPDEEKEKLWIKETGARYETYKKGEPKAIDWAEIKKRYR